MADDDKAYIAISPCGCVTAAMVAGPLPARGERAELKKWMRGGRRVEVTTCGEAKRRLEWNCQHDKAPTGKEAIEEEAERLVAEARG
jgi:hypothetical protein